MLHSKKDITSNTFLLLKLHFSLLIFWQNSGNDCNPILSKFFFIFPYYSLANRLYCHVWRKNSSPKSSTLLDLIFLYAYTIFYIHTYICELVCKQEFMWKYLWCIELKEFLEVCCKNSNNTDNSTLQVYSYIHFSYTCVWVCVCVF